MSLAEREKKFKELSSRFECDLVAPLIARHKIRPHLLEKIRIASLSYMANCLPDQSVVSNKLIADEFELLNEFKKQSPPNVTPNGMIVPKRETILAYNNFVTAFSEIMESLNIVDFIDCWLYPPNLRFKDGWFNPELLARNYQSEHRHSESWIPINTNKCISVFIPILGDAEKNGVEFFTPPPGDFSESWLTPHPSYKAGEEIADKYTKLSIPYRIGEIYLADCATLHVTTRKSGSAPRASIDINFLPQNSGINLQQESLKDRPQPKTLSEIGKTKLFVFHDSMNEFIDTKGASIHPTANSKLIDL